MGDRPARVVVIDDHPLMRDGVRRRLERAPEVCEVVGEAGTFHDSLKLIEAAKPDVAIIDVVLPDGDGIQLCRQIRSQHPETTCLIVTAHAEEQALLAAALAGAAAFLRKDADNDLVEIVKRAVSGELSLDRIAVAELVDALGHADHELAAGERLTPQESRVFTLIGQGLSNREIGEHMHLTEKTVKNYVSRVLGKLDMSRRTEAAVLAARLAERRMHSRQTRRH